MQTSNETAQAMTPDRTATTQFAINRLLNVPIDSRNQFQTASARTPQLDSEQLHKKLTGLNLEPIPLPNNITPAPPKPIGRTCIPWNIKGVKELSIHVLFQIRYWNLEARKTMVVMEERQRAV